MLHLSISLSIGKQKMLNLSKIAVFCGFTSGERSGHATAI